MSDMFRAPRMLRPHQAKAIDMLRSSLAEGNKRVVLQAATGFGKTLTAAKIIEGASAKGRKVLFTVPRLSLVNQTVSEFKREGIGHIGVIQANHQLTDASAPVQVASVQTLARRPVPDDFGLVIVDECHETFEILYTLMDRFPKVPFVGLSATPWTRGMGLHWQDLCIAITLQELIDAGYLSKFVVYAPSSPDLRGVKTVAGDYAEGGLEEVMSEKKLVASVVETWLEKGEDRPTFCFGVNRAHAAKLMEQFEASGIASGYCDSYTDSVEMGILERRFRRGEIRVMCSVRKMTTGVDWPVSCIIDAAPTQSEMLHVQKIGRGLRVNPGTEDLVVLDHASNSLRLGLVTDIHHATLCAKAKGEKAERKRKAEKLPKECGQCGALVSSLVCPFCGHERKPVHNVETVEGRLVQIKGEKKAPTRDEKAAFWGMALWVDRSRQKGGRLAKALYKGRFDCWPNGLGETPIPPDAAFLNYEKSRRIAYAKKMAEQ